MNKSAILLSTLFAAGAASAHATPLSLRAYSPGQPSLEEAGCGAKTEEKGDKQASCGAKAKEGDAKTGTKAKAKVKGKAKGDKQASCGAGTCGGKMKEGKEAPKENKGDAQASCGAKKDPKG